MFSGQVLELVALEGGLVKMLWRRKNGSVNLIDALALEELGHALDQLEAFDGLRGLLMASEQSEFIVGADISEFDAIFAMPAEQLKEQTLRVHALFCRLEDLPCPTVAAINGYALGGGLELALCTDSRVMAEGARIGTPEISLGIFPAYGGTVRLSRLAPLPVALQWVLQAQMQNAAAALAAGVVDEIARPEATYAQALVRLKRMSSGEIDWRSSRQRKLSRLPAAACEDGQAWQWAQEWADRALQKQCLPAASKTVAMMRQAVTLDRDAALRCEAEHFPAVAQSSEAAALIQIYRNEQTLKKEIRQRVGKAVTPAQVGVVGAGIMGAGIALTAWQHGSRVNVHDASEAALKRGQSTVEEQLQKQIRSGKLPAARLEEATQTLQWQSDRSDWRDCDLAIEVVVEDARIKHQVLQDLQLRVGPNCVIATNTSSLRVGALSAALSDPSRFVGLHFFNPVPAMQLVEVVPTKQTSAQTLARAVAWVVQMKKTPVVVADCPGFLVNRIITPYLRSFVSLVQAGIDPYRIDRLMQAIGWPMGPATLEDVVGLDTGSKVLDLIAEGYSERMPAQRDNILHQMAAKGWLGRKSGAGFFVYGSSGPPQPNPAVVDLLRAHTPGSSLQLSDQALVDRMMLPLWLEAALCLNEGVAEGAAHIDRALLLGLGYPRHLGGALKQIDQIGWDTIGQKVAQPDLLGPEYRLPTDWHSAFGFGRRFHP